MSDDKLKVWSIKMYSFSIPVWNNVISWKRADCISDQLKSNHVFVETTTSGFTTTDRDVKQKSGQSGTTDQTCLVSFPVSVKPQIFQESPRSDFIIRFVY